MWGLCRLHSHLDSHLCGSETWWFHISRPFKNCQSSRGLGRGMGWGEGKADPHPLLPPLLPPLIKSSTLFLMGGKRKEVFFTHFREASHEKSTDLSGCWMFGETPPQKTNKIKTEAEWSWGVGWRSENGSEGEKDERGWKVETKIHQPRMKGWEEKNWKLSYLNDSFMIKRTAWKPLSKAQLYIITALKNINTSGRMRGF